MDMSLQREAMNCLAALIKGLTESAISRLEGRSRRSNAESNIIGIVSSKRLQYFIHEATSNLSAAIRTSSKAGTVVNVSELLYMNFNSSITAASSAIKNVIIYQQKRKVIVISVQLLEELQQYQKHLFSKSHVFAPIQASHQRKAVRENRSCNQFHLPFV